MTDHSVALVDEVLTELIELVETARTVPMSPNCMVPRERVLDLLDALREVLPTEIVQARRLVADRDAVLTQARTEAAALSESTAREVGELLATAHGRADSAIADARAEADSALAEARAAAEKVLADAHDEQARLIAADGAHRQAVAAADALIAEARAQADMTVADSEAYVARLTAQAHDYADTTLAELVDHLQRLTATAQNGRAALDRG